MRKIAPLKFEFNFVDSSDSEARVNRTYKRIFEIARRNILQRRQKMKGGDKYVARNSVAQFPPVQE